MKYGVICTIVCSLSPRRRHLACVTTDEKNSGPRFVIRPLNLICCTLGADYCVWQSRGDVWFTCLNLVFARWQPGDVAARPESPRQPRDERDKNGISAPLTLIIRRNCNNDCNWNDSAIEASRFVCTLLAYVRGLNIISNLEIETKLIISCLYVFVFVFAIFPRILSIRIEKTNWICSKSMRFWNSR